MAETYVIAIVGYSGAAKSSLITSWRFCMKNMPDRPHIVTFKSQLAELLPQTYSLLRSANLVIHPLVSQIVLHGSRGPAGGCRPDSDIDLSLIVDGSEEQITEALFYDITRTTLDNWRSPTNVDLAVIYDLKKCGLKCFEQTTW
jgi:hypothetical protein